jgi:hypothetical protein
MGMKVHNQEIDKVDQASPLIILVDDMQDSDEISFYLLKSILKYFKNILVIGLVRD